MEIRAERERDKSAIRAVYETAFETDAESNLVAVLREQARPVISLVALEGNTIVGHIMFSPVVLASRPGLHIMGLAPMAVSPAHQRKGIGSKLVRFGLEECRRLGFGAVVVLGHPEYYPRFGFAPAAPLGISCEYEVSEDAFMVRELQAGYLKGFTGKIKYHASFNNF